MHSQLRRHSPAILPLFAWLSKRNAVLTAFGFFLLHSAVSRVEGGSQVGPPTGCQNLRPVQLERRLRDEGEFDTRYMAGNLEEAVDRFADLADARFISKAETYTCDAQCVQKTREIRSVFAKYGQIPSQATIPDFNIGPSFADIRQLLEGHLTEPAQSQPQPQQQQPQPQPQPFDAGQWSGSMFPEFRPVNAPEQQSTVLVPAQPQAPPRQGSSDTTNTSVTEFVVEHEGQVPNDGTIDGFRWLTPGDLARDSPIDSPPVVSGRRERSRRAAPVNSASIGQSMKIRCSKKGQEGEQGLHVLCGSCRVIRELPAEYFPRYINEVSCSGSTCFDKAASGKGRCVEQFINFSILRNAGTRDCQKWVPYTIAVPVCCSCLMSNALAQYLAMPWSGQTLTNTRPGG